MSKKIPAGILGATGVVGQRFIQMLEHHPWFEVAWLAASDRSEGRPYREAARWRLKTPIPENVARMRVSPAKPDGAPKLIFAALDSGIAAELEPQFAEAGCAVISNSSALRMQKDVPLVIPEVNADHIELLEHQSWRQKKGGFVVTNPELFRHRSGYRARPIGAAIWPGNGDGGNDAGGQWRRIPRRSFARHSRQRDPVHRQRRREDGGGDAETAGKAQWRWDQACHFCDERTVQSSRGGGRTHGIGFGKAQKEGNSPRRSSRPGTSFRTEPQTLNLPSAPRKPVIYMDAPDRPQPRFDVDSGAGMSTAWGASVHAVFWIGSSRFFRTIRSVERQALPF